jgi:hypothetical protein
MSDLSTFSQITYVSDIGWGRYGNTVGVLLTDTFCFGLTFLERMLVFERGLHATLH